MKRQTKQKSAVMDTLRRMGHTTAAALHKEAQKTCEGIGLATVYRILTDETAEGHICRLKMENSEDIFDITTEPHSHVRCIGCGLVADVPIPDFKEAVAAAERMGIAVRHQFADLQGLCQACRVRHTQNTQ